MQWRQELPALYSRLLDPQLPPEQRANTERFLMDLRTQPEVLKVHSEILCDARLSAEVKQMVVVTIKSMLTKHPLIEFHEHVFLLIFFNHWYREPSLPQKSKKLLGITLQEMLVLEANEKFREEVAKQVILWLQSRDKQETMSLSLMIAAGAAVLGDGRFADNVKQFILRTFQPFLALLLKAKQSLNPDLSKQQYITGINTISEGVNLIFKYLRRITLLDSSVGPLLYCQQLGTLVTSVLELNIQSNQMSSAFYFSVNGEPELTASLNTLKSRLCLMLSLLVMLVVNFPLAGCSPNMNPAMSNLPLIIKFAAQDTLTLLRSSTLSTLGSNSSVLPTVFELLGMLTSCLRTKLFFAAFSELTQPLMQVCLKTLALLPYECAIYEQQSQEWINRMYHIIDREEAIGSSMKQEEDEQIERFETIKTIASELLFLLCKQQDGAFTYLINMATQHLYSCEQNSQSASTMLLVLPVNKMLIRDRPDVAEKLSKLYSFLFSNWTPYYEDGPLQERINYAMLLLTFSTLATELQEQNPQLYNSVLPKCGELLQAEHIDESIQRIILQLFDQLSRIVDGDRFCGDLLLYYNSFLSRQQPVFMRMLDSFLLLVQYNMTYIQEKGRQVIVESIHHIRGQIVRQATKNNPFQHYLLKCMHVMRELAENCQEIPFIIEPIESALLQITNAVGFNKLTKLAEDFLYVMRIFVEHSKSVNSAQNQLFTIVKEVSPDQEEAFGAIQSFIYYGSTGLPQENTNLILELSLRGLTDVKKPKLMVSSCLILHSFLLAYSSSLSMSVLQRIQQELIKSLSQPINEPHVTANLQAALGLALLRRLSPSLEQENELALSYIINNVQSITTSEYALKVVVVSLCQLLLNVDYPLVQAKFSAILRTAIKLLTHARHNNPQTWMIDAQAEEEQRLMEDLIQKTQNRLKDANQHRYFKETVQKLQHSAVLKSSMAELSPAEQGYLTRAVTVERVNNKERVIVRVCKR